MTKTFNLQSGLKVIQDEYILHTPDFGFTAGLRKNGVLELDGYTSFRFNNEILENYLDVVNSGSVETLSFDYDKDDFVNINLAGIKDLTNLRRIFFNLEKKASIQFDSHKYQNFNQLMEISLKGSFPPETFEVERLAARLGIFEVSFDIFKVIYKSIENLKTLRLIGSEKKWDGHELCLLKNLKRVHLDSCSINSLDTISALKDIQVIIIAGCRLLSDISYLSQLKNLRHLVILDCPRIKNWEILKDLTALRSLRIKRSIGLSVLEELPGLCYFSIDEPKKGELGVWVKSPENNIFGSVVNSDINTLIREGVVFG